VNREANAARLIEMVLVREGGVKDVGDGMGVTRWGQTPKWLADFGFPVPTTREDAAANYRSFLTRTGLIGLCALADPLADFVIDYAVHSHHSVAIRALQAAMGTVMVDGIWGPETELAVDRSDRRRLAAKVLIAETRHQGRLITNAPDKYARYAAGWANRQADKLELLL
jgi:lysozyme family protein